MEPEGCYLQLDDGPRLYYRDYLGTNSADICILCLHGLTRNGEDFFPMISSLKPLKPEKSYRYIVPDMRGRGLSDKVPNPEDYSLPVYVRDCWKLLDHLGISNFAIVGTSMGGIMAMQMHAEQPERIQGIVLNDIGPTISADGLRYILSYLGRNMTADSWEAALAATKKRLAYEYPDLDEKQWHQLAERTYSVSKCGAWVQRYDPDIRLPMLTAAEVNTELDLWPLFEKIDKPTLCLRGELSRILSPGVSKEMCERNSFCSLLEVPKRGHVPLLDESIVTSGLQSWLQQMAGSWLLPN